MSQYLLFCRPPSPPHFFPSPHVCHATNGENVRAICIYSGIPEVRGRESESGLTLINKSTTPVHSPERQKTESEALPSLATMSGRWKACSSLLVDDEKAVKLPSHSIVGRGSLPCAPHPYFHSLVGVISKFGCWTTQPTTAP